ITAVLEGHDDIAVVGASAEPGDILTLIDSHEADLAIIDLKLHGRLDVGIDAIQQIKSRFPEVKCMVLTSFPELPNFLDAYNAGAEAFVRKEHFDYEPSLADLIRLVVAGGRYYDPALVSQMIPYLDTSRLPMRGESVRTRGLDLTKRELEVLSLIVNKCSNQEIAEKLVISAHTVKRHVSSILYKLNATDRHQAALLAVSMGLVAKPVGEERSGGA
ncbi:MAG: LuxR C-terminal-related transcriptional regulator, partial [Promethearchaeota archaeon]